MSTEPNGYSVAVNSTLDRYAWDEKNPPAAFDVSDEAIARLHNEQMQDLARIFYESVKAQVRSQDVVVDKAIEILKKFHS